MLSKVNYIQLMIAWVPLAFIITVAAGLVYLAVQQDERSSANDPQIQMAQDAAYNLQSGASVNSVVPGNQVDPSRSLAPFLIVYDQNGKVNSSQASISGQTPSLPDGIFDAVKSDGHKTFTWQPQNDTRIAAVMVHYSGSSSGFVLAGRSLREVEVRESNLQIQVTSMWLFALLGGLLLIGIFNWGIEWARQRPHFRED